MTEKVNDTDAVKYTITFSICWKMKVGLVMFCISISTVLGSDVIIGRNVQALDVQLQIGEGAIMLPILIVQLLMPSGILK